MSKAVSEKPTSIQPIVILVLYMGLYFFSQFHRTAIGPLAGEFMREFGVSAANVGVLTSSYFIIYGLLQPLYGAAIDRYGSSKVVLFTMPIYVLACYLFATSPTFESLILSRIGVAAAIACVFIAGLKATALTFKSATYGKVVGIYTGWGYTASLLGMVIPSIMLGQGLGWRQTFISVAVASLIFYVFFAAFTVRHATKKQATDPSSKQSGVKLRTLFSSNLLLIYLSTAVAYGSYVGLVSWIPKYLYDVFALTRDVAGIVAALPVAMMAIGSPLMGILADRTKSCSSVYKYTHLLTAILLAALLYSIMLSDVFLSMLFFSCSVLSLSGFTIWPTIIRKEVGERNLALLLSLVNTFVFLGAFAYPAAMGLIMDLTTPKMIIAGERIYDVGAYFWAFTLCLATLAISTLMLFARMRTKV